MCEAFGLPSFVLMLSYLGFGSLVRATGVGLLPGLVSNVTMYAAPAQVALVELYGAGASVTMISLAVALTWQSAG
jgi:hypothetical protein